MNLNNAKHVSKASYQSNVWVLMMDDSAACALVWAGYSGRATQGGLLQGGTFGVGVEAAERFADAG